MRCAALMLAGFITLALPAGPQAQGARAPFKDNYAEVNGVRLHYASVGQGPLVLFLHGYPSFWYQWKDQMAEMGRDHLAVGLDMRGYNLSSRPEGLEPYKMPHLVEDVRQFAEKIAGRDKKFVLVGHDWGANVAWVFAMYHPEMLEKLIIVNGAHPFISERELRENPAQRYASNYFFVFNKFLAPGEQPVDENDTKESAVAPRARRVRGRGGQERALHRSTIARPGSTPGRSRARRRPASITTAPITAIRRSTTASGVDDSHVVVGGGDHAGRQVDDHQDAHAGDLGHEGHGDPVGSSQRPRQVGAEPEREALPGRRPLGDAAEGHAGRAGHPALHRRRQDLPEGVGLSRRAGGESALATELSAALQIGPITVTVVR